MSIEILDDIIEELADSLGIYGAHTEEHPDGQCECRVCFSMGMSRRIRDAVQIERQLAAPPLDEVQAELKRIKRGAKKRGLVTRQQVWSQS